MDGNNHHHHHRLDISPLFVGLLGIMAGATIVAIFHCLVIGWCKDSPRRTPVPSPMPRRIIRTNNNNNHDNTRSIASTSTNSSTDNSVIHLIPVYKYTGEFKEGMCAVCLSEFKEGDEVRVLPQCAHLFHVPCIDMWLYSHSSCPLCRAEMTIPRRLHVAASMLDSSGGRLPELEPRLHVAVSMAAGVVWGVRFWDHFVAVWICLPTVKWSFLFWVWLFLPFSLGPWELELCILYKGSHANQ